MVDERRQESVERDSRRQERESESSGPAESSSGSESPEAGRTEGLVRQLVIRILMRPDTSNIVIVTRNQNEEMTLVL